MARLRIKGINTVRKRLGDGTRVTYYYHRATGSRLPDDPTSPEFILAYAEAEKIAPKDRGTLASLIRLYTLSGKFDRKRDSTRREYLRMLREIEARFGTLPLRALASPKVRGLFTDYQDEIGRDRPREADNRLSVLSAVLSHAAAKGEIADNPLRGFERIYHGDRSEFIWTEREMAAFMATAPLELQQAMILALHTGQRYGDLIRLRWSDYDGDAITLRQSKTARWSICPARRR